MFKKLLMFDQESALLFSPVKCTAVTSKLVDLSNYKFEDSSLENATFSVLQNVGAFCGTRNGNNNNSIDSRRNCGGTNNAA